MKKERFNRTMDSSSGSIETPFFPRKGAISLTVIYGGSSDFVSVPPEKMEICREKGMGGFGHG